MLAAVPIDQADVEVPDLLESALNDVGLTYYAKGSLAAQKAGLFAIVARTLSTTPAQSFGSVGLLNLRP